MKCSLPRRLASLCILAALAGPVSADSVMTPQQAVTYLAMLTAASEVCAARYPALRDNIARLDNGFDAPTLGWVREMRKSPEFASALAAARTDKQVLEITEELCKANFPRQCNAAPEGSSAPASC